MSFPSLGEIVTFILRHDLWLKEQEAAQFHQMAGALAMHYHIERIPRVKWLLENSDEMFEKLQKRQMLWRFWLMAELGFERLVQIDHDSKLITIPENPFGRFIPVQELFDHTIRWRGEVKSIDVGLGGMTVSTDYDYTVKMPGCEIYLCRLDEDGLRYKNAAIFIEHITGGSVKLDWKELVGKTDHITITRDGDSWTVNDGLRVA